MLEAFIVPLFSSGVDHRLLLTQGHIIFWKSHLTIHLLWLLLPLIIPLKLLYTNHVPLGLCPIAFEIPQTSSE